jgi:hypothetical protein
MKPSFSRSFILIPFVAGTVFGATATAGFAAGMLGSSIFSDVPEGSFYDSAVGDMYSRGIIKGFEDGDFHPNDFVTRAQIAVMLQRFANGGDIPVSSSSRSSRSSSVSSDESSVSSSSSSSRSSSSSVASAGAAGGFLFAKDKFIVPEGAGSFDLVILRQKGSKGAVSVKYTVTAGSATKEDFAEKTGRLDFKDGETSKGFSISLVDDKLGELNEVINMTLEDPTGGAVVLSPGAATLMILDNDGGCSTCSSGSSSSTSSSSAATGQNANAFALSAFAYGLFESASPLTVTVVRTGSTSAAATVNYATSNGSAKAGEHYTSVSGTLNFAAGETSKTFTVNVSDNSAIDGNKAFNITLSSPTGGAAIGTPGTSTVTIVDDESASTSGSGSLKFSASNYTVLESAGKAYITVQRVGPANRTVSVNYYTTSGTAGLSDYTAASGTLTFNPGETSKAFEIPITKDSSSEGTENVNLTIQSPVNATLLSPSTAILNIAD